MGLQQQPHDTTYKCNFKQCGPWAKYKQALQRTERISDTRKHCIEVAQMVNSTWQVLSTSKNMLKSLLSTLAEKLRHKCPSISYSLFEGICTLWLVILLWIQSLSKHVQLTDRCMWKKKYNVREQKGFQISPQDWVGIKVLCRGSPPWMQSEFRCVNLRSCFEQDSAKWPVLTVDGLPAHQGRWARIDCLQWP